MPTPQLQVCNILNPENSINFNITHTVHVRDYLNDHDISYVNWQMTQEKKLPMLQNSPCFSSNENVLLVSPCSVIEWRTQWSNHAPPVFFSYYVLLQSKQHRLLFECFLLLRSNQWFWCGESKLRFLPVRSTNWGGGWRVKKGGGCMKDTPSKTWWSQR